jgi:hypothetical protein
MPKPILRLALGSLLLVLASCFLSAQTCGPWQWVNPLPQGNTLLAVAYGAGHYVAVGRAGSIVASEDGVSWSARESSSF